MNFNLHTTPTWTKRTILVKRYFGFWGEVCKIKK